MQHLQQFTLSFFIVILIVILVLTSGGPKPANPAVNAPAGQQSTPAQGLAFMNVSAAAGIMATHQASWNEYSQEPFTDGYMAAGSAWGDYDNDGWPDLYVTGNMDNNVLYHNNGDGTFAVAAASANLNLPEIMSGGAAWADYDNDGWPDLYVLNHGANVLFHNEAGHGFSDVTALAGVGDAGKGTTATWGDYDGDSYLDLYVTNWSCYPKCDPVDHNLAADRLYHNQGDGTFSDVSASLVYEKRLGAGFSASFVDFDGDGDVDIYVVNDKLQNPIGNVLWRNEGAGCVDWCWRDVSEATGTNVALNGMGLAVGDYDNDLDLDFYFSNMVKPMVLLQNQGEQTFTDRAFAARVAVGPSDTVGWGTGFFDYNNDGWLDLYLATTEFRLYDGGMHFSYPNYLFQNETDGRFSNVSRMSWAETAQPSVGFAYADYDNDGWLDFVVGNWNEGYLLYHNEGQVGQDNHWLTIRLTGAGPVNRDAIGTRVYLTTNDGRTQMQVVKSGSSLGSGHDRALHFGLGAATIESVRVVWPDGREDHFTDVVVDQIWYLAYE